jgi:hypothetical protein
MWFLPKEFFLHQKQNCMEQDLLPGLENTKKSLNVDNLKDFDLIIKDLKEIRSKNFKLISMSPNVVSVDKKFKSLTFKVSLSDIKEFTPIKFYHWKVKIAYLSQKQKKKYIFVDVHQGCEFIDGIFILNTFNIPFSLGERQVNVSLVCESNEECILVGPPLLLQYKSGIIEECNNSVSKLIKLQSFLPSNMLSVELMNTIEETPDVGCLIKLLRNVENWTSAFEFSILSYFSCFDEKNSTLSNILNTNIFDVNQKDSFGFSPIYYAETFECEKNIQTLIEHQAIHKKKFSLKIQENKEKKKLKKFKIKSQQLSSGNSELMKIIPMEMNFNELKKLIIQIHIKYVPITSIQEKYMNSRYWRILFSDPCNGHVLHNSEIQCVERSEDIFILSTFKIPQIKYYENIHVSAMFAEKNRIVHIGPKKSFEIKNTPTRENEKEENLIQENSV